MGKYINSICACDLNCQKVDFTSKSMIMHYAISSLPKTVIFSYNDAEESAISKE